MSKENKMVEKLQRELTELRADYRSVSEKLERRDLSEKRIQGELTELRKEFRSKSDKLERRDKRVDLLENTLEDEKKENDRLGANETKLKESIQDLTEKIEKIENKYKKDLKEIDKMHKKIVLETEDNYNKEIDLLEQEIEDKVKESNKQTEEIEKLTIDSKNSEKLTKDLEKAQDRIREIQENLKKTEGQLKEMTTSHDKISARLEATDIENNNNKEQIKKHKQIEDKSKETLDKLFDKVNKSNEKIIKLEKEIGKKEKEIGKKEKEIEGKEKEIEGKEKEIKDKEKTIDKYLDGLKNESNVQESMRNELKKKQDEINELVKIEEKKSKKNVKCKIGSQPTYEILKTQGNLTAFTVIEDFNKEVEKGYLPEEITSVEMGDMNKVSIGEGDIEVDFQESTEILKLVNTFLKREYNIDTELRSVVPLELNKELAKETLQRELEKLGKEIGKEHKEIVLNIKPKLDPEFLLKYGKNEVEVIVEGLEKLKDICDLKLGLELDEENIKEYNNIFKNNPYTTEELNKPIRDFNNRK